MEHTEELQKSFITVLDDIEGYAIDLQMRSKKVDIIAYQNLMCYISQVRREIKKETVSDQTKTVSEKKF